MIAAQAQGKAFSMFQAPKVTLMVLSGLILFVLVHSLKSRKTSGSSKLESTKSYMMPVMFIQKFDNVGQIVGLMKWWKVLIILKLEARTRATGN